MRAAFYEIDITPKPGIEKIGWLQPLKGEVILDPLFARMAVFENKGKQIGFIQLDTLSVRWTQVNEIRKRIKARHKFPSENIMVSATHNHAGPAVAGFPPYQKRDDEYIEFMTEKCVEGFGKALGNMQEAKVGFNSVFNFDVAHNRRTKMRDGTVKTQTPSTNKDFLCLEGPRDAEVAVIAVKSKDDKLLGAMINYACHPTHHGGTNEISAGYPGVLANELKKQDIPVTLFLNGAYGNVITVDFERQINLSKEEAGKSLAESFMKAYSDMTFSEDWQLDAVKETIELPYRKITQKEEKGKVPGAQRFRSDEYYENCIAYLKTKTASQKVKLTEIQVLRMGDIFLSGAPGEYFVEYQLAIKEAFHPSHALTVGGANGMMGYIPTKDAFKRGGYETTLITSSCMAPETGDMIASKIIELIKKIK